MNPFRKPLSELTNTPRIQSVFSNAQLNPFRKASIFLSIENREPKSNNINISKQTPKKRKICDTKESPSYIILSDDEDEEIEEIKSPEVTRKVQNNIENKYKASETHKQIKICALNHAQQPQNAKSVLKTKIRAKSVFSEETEALTHSPPVITSHKERKQGGKFVEIPLSKLQRDVIINRGDSEIDDVENVAKERLPSNDKQSKKVGSQLHESNLNHINSEENEYNVYNNKNNNNTGNVKNELLNEKHQNNNEDSNSKSVNITILKDDSNAVYITPPRYPNKKRRIILEDDDDDNLKQEEQKVNEISSSSSSSLSLNNNKKYIQKKKNEKGTQISDLIYKLQNDNKNIVTTKKHNKAKLALPSTKTKTTTTNQNSLPKIEILLIQLCKLCNSLVANNNTSNNNRSTSYHYRSIKELLNHLEQRMETTHSECEDYFKKQPNSLSLAVSSLSILMTVCFESLNHNSASSSKLSSSSSSMKSKCKLEIKSDQKISLKPFGDNKLHWSTKYIVSTALQSLSILCSLMMIKSAEIVLQQFDHSYEMMMNLSHFLVSILFNSPIPTYFSDHSSFYTQLITFFNQTKAKFSTSNHHYHFENEEDDEDEEMQSFTIMDKNYSDDDFETSDCLEVIQFFEEIFQHFIQLIEKVKFQSLPITRLIHCCFSFIFYPHSILPPSNNNHSNRLKNLQRLFSSLIDKKTQRTQLLNIQQSSLTLLLFIFQIYDDQRDFILADLQLYLNYHLPTRQSSKKSAQTWVSISSLQSSSDHHSSSSDRNHRQYENSSKEDCILLISKFLLLLPMCSTNDSPHLNFLCDLSPITANQNGDMKKVITIVNRILSILINKVVTSSSSHSSSNRKNDNSQQIHRSFLELVLNDFLKCLYLPNWPIAEFFVSSLCSYFFSLLSRNPSATSHLLENGDDSQFENLKLKGDLDSSSKLYCLKLLTSASVTIAKLHHSTHNYQSPSSNSSSISISMIRQYYIVESTKNTPSHRWLQNIYASAVNIETWRFSQSTVKSESSITMANECISPSIHSLSDDKSIINPQTDICSLLRKHGIERSKQTSSGLSIPTIMKLFLFLLNNDANLSIRNASIRSLAQITQSLPDLLSDQLLQNTVLLHVLDVSPSVRQSSLLIISTRISSLLQQFTQNRCPIELRDVITEIEKWIAILVGRLRDTAPLVTFTAVRIICNLLPSFSSYFSASSSSSSSMTYFHFSSSIQSLPFRLLSLFPLSSSEINSDDVNLNDQQHLTKRASAELLNDPTQLADAISKFVATTFTSYFFPTVSSIPSSSFDMFAIEELSGEFLRLSTSSLEDTDPCGDNDYFIASPSLNNEAERLPETSLLVPIELRSRLGDHKIQNILQLSGIKNTQNQQSDQSLVSKFENFLSFCLEAKENVGSWDWLETFLHHINITYSKSENSRSHHNSTFMHFLCQTLFVQFINFYCVDVKQLGTINDDYTAKKTTDKLITVLSKSTGVITVISKQHSTELAMYFPLLLQLFLPVLINNRVSDQCSFKVNDLPVEILVDIIDTLRRVLCHLPTEMSDQIQGFLSMIIKGNSSMKVVESALSALFTLAYLSPISSCVAILSLHSCYFMILSSNRQSQSSTSSPSSSSSLSSPTLSNIFSPTRDDNLRRNSTIQKHHDADIMRAIFVAPLLSHFASQSLHLIRRNNRTADNAYVNQRDRDIRRSFKKIIQKNDELYQLLMSYAVHPTPAFKINAIQALRYLWTLSPKKSPSNSIMNTKGTKDSTAFMLRSIPMLDFYLLSNPYSYTLLKMQILQNFIDILNYDISPSSFFPSHIPPPYSNSTSNQSTSISIEDELNSPVSSPDGSELLRVFKLQRHKKNTVELAVQIISRYLNNHPSTLIKGISEYLTHWDIRVRSRAVTLIDLAIRSSLMHPSACVLQLLLLFFDISHSSTLTSKGEKARVVRSLKYIDEQFDNLLNFQVASSIKVFFEFSRQKYRPSSSCDSFENIKENLGDSLQAGREENVKESSNHSAPIFLEEFYLLLFSSGKDDNNNGKGKKSQKKRKIGFLDALVSALTAEYARNSVISLLPSFITEKKGISSPSNNNDNTEDIVVRSAMNEFEERNLFIQFVCSAIRRIRFQTEGEVVYLIARLLPSVRSSAAISYSAMKKTSKRNVSLAGYLEGFVTISLLQLIDYLTTTYSISHRLIEEYEKGKKNQKWTKYVNIPNSSITQDITPKIAVFTSHINSPNIIQSHLELMENLLNKHKLFDGEFRKFKTQKKRKRSNAALSVSAKKTSKKMRMDESEDEEFIIDNYFSDT